MLKLDTGSFPTKDMSLLFKWKKTMMRNPKVAHCQLYDSFYKHLIN